MVMVVLHDGSVPRDGEEIVVNLDHVIYMRPASSGTLLYYFHGGPQPIDTIWVQESPNEILVKADNNIINVSNVMGR